MAVEAGGIGARLRAGREKLGLTVLQVAERIHTDPKIVEAIEAESFEALGAPVYARGHIRHYADLVGESANELTQTYSKLSQVGQPDLTRIVKAPARPEANKLVAPALVVIVVFAVAGAIWWISALSKKTPQMSDTHVVTDEARASTAAVAAPEGARAATDSAASAPAAGGEPGPSGPPTATSMQPPPGSNGAEANSATPAEPTSPDVPRQGRSPSIGGAGSGQGHSSAVGSASAGSTPSGTTAPRTRTDVSNGATAGGSGASGTSASAHDGTASATTPGTGARLPPALQLRTPSPTVPAASTGTASTLARTASAAPARPASSGAAVASPPAPEPAAATHAKAQSSVTLRYSADSWTEVYDASGARLFYDVGAANSVQTVVGTPPLRVVLGNASGVSVEYNGHSKPIAKMSRPDGSVQFSITRSGDVVRAKPVADGG